MRNLKHFPPYCLQSHVFANALEEINVAMNITILGIFYIFLRCCVHSLYF